MVAYVVGESLVGLLVCLAFGSLFLVALLFPSVTKQGVNVEPHGFEVRRPFRKVKFIPFEQIENIIAIARGDGPLGEDVSFLFFTSDSQVNVSEYELYQSGLLEALKTNPHFMPHAYREALNHTPRGFDLVVGKRFQVWATNDA